MELWCIFVKYCHPPGIFKELLPGPLKGMQEKLHSKNKWMQCGTAATASHSGKD